MSRDLGMILETTGMVIRYEKEPRAKMRLNLYPDPRELSLSMAALEFTLGPRRSFRTIPTATRPSPPLSW